jgi:hypothetical protein
MSKNFNTNDLQRIWYDRLVRSFDKPIRSRLEPTYYCLYHDEEFLPLSETQQIKVPAGLKLRLNAATIDDFIFLRQKYNALRYRIKASSPIETLLIVYLAVGEKTPTKHKGVSLRSAAGWGPCRAIDIVSGRYLDTWYKIAPDRIPVLTPEQLAEILGEFGFTANEEGEQ